MPGCATRMHSETFLRILPSFSKLSSHLYLYLYAFVASTGGIERFLSKVSKINDVQSKSVRKFVTFSSLFLSFSLGASKLHTDYPISDF